MYVSYLFKEETESVVIMSALHSVIRNLFSTPTLFFSSYFLAEEECLYFRQRQYPLVIFKATMGHNTHLKCL